MNRGKPGKAMLALVAVSGVLVIGFAISIWNFFGPARDYADHPYNLKPVYVDFTRAGWKTDLYLADYSVDRSHFYRVNFSPASISQSTRGLKLRMKDAAKENNWPLDSAEIHVPRKTGYGRYEVIMKPAGTPGVISSFFTYTGPFYGNPHDEIDIEFLGKNRDEVEFNTYKEGRPSGGVRHELGYIASEEFHLYAYEWQPEFVKFYIDGVLVHELTDEDVELPRYAGKMMVNLWTGTMTDWHGEAQITGNTTSEYKCIAYRPAGDKKSPLCSG